MSGIGLDSSVLQEYNNFQKDKSSVAFLIFKIENQKSVVIEEKVMKDDIPALLEEAESKGFRKQPLESDNYAVLRSKLIKLPPRYATIVVEYKVDTAQKKVACICWYVLATCYFVFHILQIIDGYYSIRIVAL